MRNNRRGQLTIFIIIGIALLFSTALILYIRQNLVQYKPPVEVTTEQVPTELQPLQQYVTDCIRLTALEGLRKAGMQGGYIDTSKIVVNQQDATSGQGILFAPESDLKVPYWYYMKDPNSCQENCEFASEQPPLYRSGGQGRSVEEQMDKYVNERLAICLADFAPFKSQMQIQAGAVRALTTIAKTDVFEQVTFPLTITLPGRSEKLSQFVVKIPLNLGKLYDLAAELTRRESQKNFLEFLAINLIDSYSSPDSDHLPPLADTTFFRGSQVTWQQRNVKSKIEELLMTYTPALQVVGTANFKGNLYQGSDQFTQGIYSFFILSNLSQPYQANAEFTYLGWWPTYLHVTPSSGELIKPTSASGFHELLSFFGITQYKFAYDVSYPMLITLTDPAALDGEGYTFQFALESNVRNNAPLKSNVQEISVSGRSRSTLACESFNHNSGNITIDVSDSMTGVAVSNALIYFGLGSDVCFIGETSITNGKGILESRMPVGVGSLIISKEGYLSKTIPFGTVLDENQALSVVLDPIVDIDLSLKRLPFSIRACNVSVNLYNITSDFLGGALAAYNGIRSGGAGRVDLNCQWGPYTSKPDLEPTQSAVVSFVRTPETDGQEQFVTVVEMKGSGNRTQKVQLTPGKYQITGSLFDNQLTVIPEEQTCHQADSIWGFFGAQDCDTIDAVTFPTFPKGGVSIPSFTIDATTLKNSREIVVTLIEVPSGYVRDPNTGATNMKHSDMEQMGKVEEYSSNYATLVEPQFR